MDPERERGIVVRARTDAEAYGTLYDHYLPRLYGFVSRRVADRASAEAITASTFQRGLEAIQSATLRTDTLGGWLFRVAASAIVDQARHAEGGAPDGVRAGDVAEPDADHARALVADEVATAAFAAAIDRDEVRAALRRVSEAQRRLIVLKYFDELSDAELCGALGISTATLAVRLERSLRALHAATTRNPTRAGGRSSHVA
ncbi:MAG TPA: sigma-70 family RNA polymerase sigma factor [Candidatus Limnocylindrales bacterium]|nr:sigma-70 family RNA polymerase sigma factor [Candidatus Limnocylindrales bacterium]